MKEYIEPAFQIIFGDALTGFEPLIYKNKQSLLLQNPFTQLKCKNNIRDLLFLHQIHSTEGVTISLENELLSFPAFFYSGDFLVTNLNLVGIAVATADCLPIILYCSKKNVIGIVHAGWRGSVNGVAKAALNVMKNSFGIHEEEIRVFFGPSAKSCCYQVGAEVINKIPKEFKKDVLSGADNRFLDLPYLNQLLLEKIGIASQAFNYNYNDCTICNLHYHSYRREKTANRHMTIAFLR
ncbi:MAG: polyphenol oxidase family protein [Candidatus Babeliales bacterium]